MAHEITDTDEMFSVREMPWHGLGHVLEENPTRAEAQALVHPWEPVTEPVYRAVPVIDPVEGPITRYEEVEGSQAVVRSDNGATLGVTSDTLGLITNEELWDVAEAVGKVGTDIHIETGGSLRGGRDVWALLRLAEPLQVKGDPNGGTVAFLALQNNHVGGGSFRAQAVNTRIVCANTSSAADIEARKNGYEFNFRHTSGVKDRIEEAKAAVAMWREGVTMWQQAMDHLVTVPVTPSDIEAFIERFQPMPPAHLTTERVRSNVDKARAEFRDILTSDTQVGVNRTAYGLYQAAIEYNSHFRSVKGKDAIARRESHFRRSMLDDGGLARKSLKIIQDLVTV